MYVEFLLTCWSVIYLKSKCKDGNWPYNGSTNPENTHFEVLDKSFSFYLALTAKDFVITNYMFVNSDSIEDG